MPERKSWFHVGNDGRELAIYIDGEIPSADDDLFSAINSISTPERVDFYINSLGGSLFTGFAIANRIGDWQRAGVHVRAHVVGVAGSAAALVAAEANEVCIAEDGFLFIHAAEYPNGGPADAHSVEMTDLMAARLARKAGRPVAEVLELLAAGERWLNAEQAVAAGFADVVEGLSG